jgi:hypothetical protein
MGCLRALGAWPMTVGRPNPPTPSAALLPVPASALGEPVTLIVPTAAGPAILEGVIGPPLLGIPLPLVPAGPDEYAAILGCGRGGLWSMLRGNNPSSRRKPSLNFASKAGLKCGHLCQDNVSVRYPRY